MEIPKGMKTKFLIFLLALLPNLSAGAQTGLFERYSHHEGVRVAEVDGFKLDSATAVNVLVIEAESPDGWRWMQREFAIGEPAPEQQRDLLAGNDVVLFAQRDRNQPGKPAPVVGETVDAVGSCYLGISYLSHTVFVFTPRTQAEADVVVAFLVRKMLRLQ